jgi:HlyD family secretion protein
MATHGADAVRRGARAALALAALAASGCGDEAPADRVRASGYVEATEVQVAPEVGGRLLEVRVEEGDRVAAGDLVARLDTADVELAIARAVAERRQADAELRLIEAGARPEDIRQAAAQVDAAGSELAAIEAEHAAAEQDLERFEALLRSNSGSRKQRDDAATRRDVARERMRAAAERVRAARETLARLRAGARPEELAVARARVAAVDARIAALEKAKQDAAVHAPVAGIVTAKLADAGELVAPRTPILVVTDLDEAWVNVFVDEPLVPRLTLGQKATIHTDAGSSVEGTLTFISPRAEFTPRNVQTASERAKLVYRVKVAVDNREGVLKQGMPVEAELVFAR